MKKIYSLVLMAMMLLVGTNAWAQISLVYNEGGKADKTFTDLQAAIDYVAPGDSATITLNAAQILDEGLLIPHITKNDTAGGVRIANLAKQRICINLNGYNIETSSTNHQCAIALLKGVLRITGAGQVVRHQTPSFSGNWQRGVIVVSGADANKNDAASDRSKQEWSVLYVDKDVTVYSAHEGTFGIGIQDLGNTAPAQRGFDLKFADYSTKHTGGTGPMWNPEGKDQWSAFGVKLMIDGTVFGERRGVNVLGNINQTPGIVENHKARVYAAYPYYDHNFPYIKIGSTANVYCSPSGITDDGNGGIYLGGWAVVDIHGAVHGQTGIMVKAGDVKLIDGQVYSDDNTTAASNNGNYHGTVNGSGIYVTSSSSYAGETTVAITGDSYVAGASGSAIIDVCATSSKESTDSKVTNVAITGGTIVGGDEGAISLGTGTDNVTEISGGNVQGDIDVGHASDTDDRTHASIEDFLPKNEDYHVTTVTVTDPVTHQTTTTVVVSEGVAPDAKETVHDQSGSVKWKWASTTKTDAMKDSVAVETMPAGEKVLTLNELEINQNYPQTLIVKDGYTLNVGRVVMGEQAQIIVEPGAKFIVTGEQGIVAPKTSNIILKATATKHATFLFNPAVTSNRHPNATVELVSYSFYKDATDYEWQRLGLPVWNAMEEVTSSVHSSVYAWGDDNKWKNLGYLDPGTPFANVDKMNRPFVVYNFIAYQANPGAVYTFKGGLVGNEDANLNVDLEWKSFPNSYMADIDLAAVLAGLATATNLDKTIYKATLSGLGHYTWDALDAEWVAGAKLDPMQAVVFHNSSADAEATVLNYKNMVWTPATTPAAAPARRAASDNTAKLRVIVTNENGLWDNVKITENANSNSSVKYMNDDVNIYAMAEEKSAIIAAESIENMYLGFSTVKGGNFTIEFANVEGREFTLIDHETGARVAMVEGNAYEFTAAANTANDYRFEIVESAKLPTAIDNTEAVKSAKGIYTITGQYVGEMNVWNTLPAGVYVINGEKRVK